MEKPFFLEIYGTQTGIYMDFLAEIEGKKSKKQKNYFFDIFLF